ncbi:MAG: hypothetical protein JWL72_2362 [Ilumatobacteraceae bacterium]|nr:hypothetical protein [Ilumatobacteraceae bacterium]
MPPKNSNVSKIVIGVIVVAVVAVVAVIVATRGGNDTKTITAPTEETSSDDSSDTTDVSIPATAAPEVSTTTDATDAPTTSSSEPTRVTLNIPTITTSLPNATTVPPTAPPVTATATTVVAPTTTVPFVLPAGALDLGYQVYIPVPEGYTDTKSDTGLDTISNPDASTKLSIQVLSRTAGENPAVLMQEYADSFTDEFEATSFSSTVRYTLSGTMPAYEYGTYYEAYDANEADGVSLAGALYVFQRADGLSVVYDVFGPGATMGLPEEAFNTFLSSFSAAPLVGPAGVLQAFPNFRPTTSIPLAMVSNVLGFTPTPDFAPATDPNGGTRVSTGTEDFTVNLLQAQATADAAVSAADGLLASEYTDITFDASIPYDPYQGLTHVGITWRGTYTDGNPVAGAIDLYWDPKSTNAIAIARDWYIQDNGQEPSAPQTSFMNAAVTDDIAFGIPSP